MWKYWIVGLCAWGFLACGTSTKKDAEPSEDSVVPTDAVLDVAAVDDVLSDTVEPETIVAECVSGDNTCEADTECIEGLCLDPCSLAAAEKTGLGCQYLAVDLENDSGAAQAGLAVLLANPSAQNPVTVTVYNNVNGDALEGFTVDLAPGGHQVLPLPDRSIQGTLKGLYPYDIQGTAPFIAHQLNPATGTEDTGSSDRTRLLPLTATSTEFLAVTGQNNAFVTVMARWPDTEVSVRPSANCAGGGGIIAMEAGKVYTLTLEAGDLINVRGATNETDLTGTEIWSTKPVAAFGGSVLARSAESCCADHMEHQLMPTATWGKVVVGPRSSPRGQAPDYWRVIAAKDNTTVTFEPSVSVPVALNRGEWVGFHSLESFVASADGPIQLVRILASAQEATGTGKYCVTHTDCPVGQQCFDSEGTGIGRCFSTCVVNQQDCPSSVYGCHESPMPAGGGTCRRSRCGQKYGPCAVNATCVDGEELSVCFEVCQQGLTCSEPGAECGLLVGQAVCDSPACGPESPCPDGATCFSNGDSPGVCQWSCTTEPSCAVAGYRCLSNQLYSPDEQWFEGAICVPPGCVTDADCPAAHRCYAKAGSDEPARCRLIGDPSLAWVAPVEQFKRVHTWTVPPGFEVQWIDVVAPVEASVLLDGQPVEPHSFKAVGNDYKLAAQLLSEGVHRLEATSPIFVMGYGFGIESSYDAMGGSRLLDLRVKVPGPTPGDDVIGGDVQQDTSDMDSTDGTAPGSPTWEGDIRPLLFTYCKDCHLLGADSGALVLDDYAVVNTPSTFCPDSTIGQAMLLKVLGDPTCQGTVMPPAGNGLTSEEIATIQQWLDGGMPES